MSKRRGEFWALKTLQGNWVTSPDLLDSQPVPLFRLLRDAESEARRIDPGGRMIQPVKVVVTIQEVGEYD